jgi:hypothetical protein
MRKSVWMLSGLIAFVAAPAWAADTDAPAAADPGNWARWQGRLSLGTAAPAARPGASEGPAVRLPNASVMGDYYFSRSFLGITQLGGFRATSGLIFGPRGVLSTGQPAQPSGSAFSIGSRLLGQTASPYSTDTSSDSATVPYLGLGYTGLAAHNGWSFNADLGLVAQSNSSARLGRVGSAGQSLDDAVREMRLAPLVQFGVSYSF